MNRKIPWALVALAPLVLRADADWKSLSARFPQAMAVVEDSSDRYDVAADGKYVSTSHYRATILQEPGIGQLSKFSDSYYEKYDQLKVKKAVVIGPNGKTTPVDAANIKDIPMPADGPFYLQNVRLVVISFPQLQVGSTVDVELESRRSAPPMDNAFSLLNGLQRDMPVLKQALQVTLPSTQPLAWKVYRGEVKFSKSEKEGRTTYDWVCGEQPQLIPEPSMPPASEVSPVLAVSTIPDWKAVSRWYAGLCEEGQKMTPELEKLVAQITAGKTTQEDKIRALYYWASREIRYVETTMSGEKAGLKPVSAAQTYERKYGVCRDKAQFLVTLLKSIGVDASVTLITSGIRQDVDLPGIQFNHAIVAIRRADGHFSFLDPTAEDSRQYLPSSDQYKFALVCTKQGEDIQSTPIAPPSENRMDIAVDTTLGADGSIRSRVVMSPTGIYDMVFRQFLNSMPPAKREMVFKAIAGQLMPGASLSDFSLPDLNDLEAPVRMAFTMSAPAQGIQAGTYLMFTTPAQGGRFDLLLGSLMSGATSPQRRYPLQLAATVQSLIREQIHLPEGYAVRSLPEALEVKGPGSMLARRVESNSQGLSYTEDFTASQMYYSGEAYDALRTQLGQRVRLRDGKVILVRQGGVK